MEPKTLAILGEASQVNPVFVAVFRGQAIETIGYVDKKTGKPESFEKHALGLESVAGLQIVGEIEYPRGAKAVPLPYKKDQRILVTLSGMTKTLGQTTIRISHHQPA